MSARRHALGRRLRVGRPMPHRAARRAVRAKELFGFVSLANPVRRRSGRASGRRTVCECRFKGELRTSVAFAHDFRRRRACAALRHAAMASRGVAVLPGRVVPFRHCRRRRSFPVLANRAIGGAAVERFARAYRRRVAHRNNRLISWRSSPAYGFQFVNRKQECERPRVTPSAPPMRGRARRGSLRRRGQR